MRKNKVSIFLPKINLLTRNIVTNMLGAKEVRFLNTSKFYSTLQFKNLRQR